MVQWQGDATEAERTEALARVAGTRRDRIHTAPMRARGEGVLEVIELAAGASLEGALALYRQEAGVRYVEVDQRMRQQAVSNDPAYLNGSLWGLYGGDVPTAVGPAGTSNAFGSHAEVAWNQGFTGSSSVYVGIIDEGFEFTHPDLAANSWSNSFDPVDGIDNDGNGYIDDVHGWDFFNDDNSVYDGFSDDHGTHVAGTIGAAGGNGVGVSGVNWNVTMIATKFLGASGGFTSGAVEALDYLTDLKRRHGLNIVASNNSWGGSGYSQALHEAIIRAAKQNILFITAAGNSSADNDGLDYYPAQYNTTVAPSGVTPATYDAVVSVASISSDGALSSFSSYGSTTVDLGAPGSSILSTVPGGGYGYYSGTSMATPHVTGAAALYAAAYPGSTAAQIRAALLASTTPTPSLQGKTVTGGRLNLADLLNPSTIPSVSLSVAPAGVLEDGAANLVFTFSRTGPATSALTVNYGVGGSATLGVDYGGIAATPASKSVSFAAGQASVTVTVDPTADGAAETDETVALTLSEGAGYTVGTAGAVVGTIQNDDYQVVEAFGGTKLVKDLANKLFAQLANNTPVSIKYGGVQVLQGGFAGWETLGAETVAGVNQLMWKNTVENYLSIWKLDSNWNWTSSQGAWGLTSAEALQQESNFQQDFNGDGIIGGGGVSAIVSLSVSPASVLEDGAANLVYTFSRTGSASNALTVSYGVGGSATLGVDYSGIAATPASRSVSFAAGQASVTVTVDPTADGEAEPDETVALTLQAGTGYTVGTAGAVVGTIQNDDYQVVEAFGGTKLVKDSANRFFAQVANNTPVSIKYGGSQVVQGGISGWETLGVETVAGVNQVMWKYTLGNSLSIWKLDGNWNWTSSQGGWGLNSAEALQQETIFQQDFNGNGIIGLGQAQNFTLPM
jgi:subtilisin family serine protease